ncbi:hypothetical protein C3L33_21596, partial [Rhododendron williamsianum]
LIINGGRQGQGSGSGGESRRATTSSFVTVGDRQRFTVELRPGETTIVSWKKLVKDSTKAQGPASVPEPPPANAHPALESRLAPGHADENDAKDAPPASRFSAVIEKIERLYVGKNSSDDEDLNDIPDDDEYDTEDSFIDDAELVGIVNVDDYFQFLYTVCHDMTLYNDLALEPANGLKMGLNVKLERLLTSTGPSHVVALPSVRPEEMKFQNQMNSSAVSAKKKYAETKTSLDPSRSSKVSEGDASLLRPEEKDIDKQKTMAPSNFQGDKLKDGGDFSDASVPGKSSHAQSKTQFAKSSNDVDELDQAVQRREKDGIRERFDLNVSEGTHSTQTVDTSLYLVARHTEGGDMLLSLLASFLATLPKPLTSSKALPWLDLQKAPLQQRKEGSSVRYKSSMLEKAIRELENMVAESRPPSMEVQNADISSQAVKRRLPREVKQKLAKVARLAQASHGKISKELVNRLMSILGHLVQLRTLKALEQQAGASDDFQEIGNEGKEVIKRKYSMDDALEDSICDLYDLYVQGLDEDAGPQARKLYAEVVGLCFLLNMLRLVPSRSPHHSSPDEWRSPPLLVHFPQSSSPSPPKAPTTHSASFPTSPLLATVASPPRPQRLEKEKKKNEGLWPDGYMDNHGIKRAICRAKDRKRALYSRHKDQEKIKRKKLLIQRNEEAVRVDGSSIAQPQNIQEKLVTDSSNYGLKPVSNAAEANTTVRVSNTISDATKLHRPKQEKVKGVLSNPNDMTTMGALTKKKVKRKPEFVSADGEERHKLHRQVSPPIRKSSLPLVAPPPPVQKPSLPMVAAPPPLVQKPSLPMAAAPRNFEV